MDEVIIEATENGPYKVTGPVKIVDPDGNEYRAGRKTYFLCRCGQSANKPFCDSTHASVGFCDDNRAAVDVSQA